jgi:hypothetical protein
MAAGDIVVGGAVIITFVIITTFQLLHVQWVGRRRQRSHIIINILVAAF